MLRSNAQPLTISWKYDRIELLMDGIVHAIGLGLALIGATALMAIAYESTQGLQTASIVIYAFGLLTMLGSSAAYNVWPVSPRKWVLRRLDQSAIFLFIAATYTPLMAPLAAETVTCTLLLAVWVVAALGVALKLALPGRFDRASIALCLVLGWSGVFAYEPLVAKWPSSTLWLIGIGGGLYSIGIVFHLWDNLRFQNAIWHAFVLVAAVCHYVAIFDGLGASSSVEALEVLAGHYSSAMP